MIEISIDDAVSLDVTDLQKLLGTEVARKRLAAKPPSDDELKSLGDQRFNSLRPKLQEKICENERVRQIFSNETEEKLLVVAVMDAGAAILTGVPLVLVSTLIVKIGLKHFCAPA